MPNCIICHGPLISTDTWGKLLSLSNSPPLCEQCSSKLEKIIGETCSICDRPFSNLAPEFRQDDKCLDCMKWQNDPRWQDILIKNRSIYTYKPFLKETLSLFKFRGDHAISQIFKQDFQRVFKKHFDKKYIIVPIPLSYERLYERGFNQAKILAELLHLPLTEPLTRIHLEKQSKKSRSERLETANIFTLIETFKLTGAEIVLIDDIYTTGSTLRHAAEVLKQAGALSVSSLTLARS
ncbi:ComF family protein [Cytobacillus suaedae]|nr:ComF family protein [Cytobacillus suaedae]